MEPDEVDPEESEDYESDDELEVSDSMDNDEVDDNEEHPDLVDMISQGQNKAFIVSPDTIQMVGYEVEEVMALSEVATHLLQKIKNPTRIGF